MKLRLLLVCVFIFWSRAAGAQVFIEQGKVNLTVKRGQSLTGEVTVNNTSNKELQAKVYWEDFVYQPPFDGAKKFMPAGTSEVSLANWIQFSPHEIVLPPFGKKTIAYTIQVPPDVKGGHYGVLFVEPETELSKADKGVKVITRVGCLFFVETEDKIKKASADGMAFSGSHLKGKFSNQGNVILLPQATYYIMDPQSMVADRGDLKTHYVPPGAAFDIDVALSPKLAPGDYTIVLTFDLNDGDVVVKEVDFTKNSDSDYVLKTVRD
jgi:hypothetical protein